MIIRILILSLLGFAQLGSAGPLASCSSDVTPFFYQKKVKVGEIAGDETRVSVRDGNAYLGATPLLWFGSSKNNLSFSETELRMNKSVFEFFKVEEGKWGYANGDGEVVIEPQYDSAQLFCNGLAGVKLGGKWGFINKAGETVIPHIYDDARNFTENKAAVKGGTRWTLIDKKNVPCQSKFVRLKSLADGFAVVGVLDPQSDELLYGLIDGECKAAIVPHYEDLNYHAGLIGAKSNNLWGFIDLKETPLSPVQYEEATPSFDSLWIVSINGKKGFASAASFLAPIMVEEYRPATEGRIAVRVNGLWGYLDSASGKWVVSPTFSAVLPFSFGRAVVGLAGWLEGRDSIIAPNANKVGIIDLKGRWIVQPTLYQIYSFSRNEFGLVSARAATRPLSKMSLDLNGNVIP